MAAPPPELLAEALATDAPLRGEARSAARELSRRYEEINLLYSIDESSAPSHPSARRCHRILSDVADVLARQASSLWVLDPAEQTLHLARRGRRGSAADPDRRPDSVTAPRLPRAAAARWNRGRGSPDPTMDPRPQGQEASSRSRSTSRRATGRRVRSACSAGRQATNVRFTAGDERLLTTIASQVGAALETHRLMAESVRRERLERELELAHNLQLKLLPDASCFEGIHVAARCVPADSVGGDFYHLFRLSGDRYGVMIGDVSSHGFSAALIMAMVMSAAAIYAQEADPPAEVLRRLHRALIDELESTEMHLSIFYGVVDPAAGTLRYANAGHPRVPHRRGGVPNASGREPAAREAGRRVRWGSSVALSSDLLCLFTDGLSDAFAPTGAWRARRGSGQVPDARLPAAEILDHLFRIAGRARQPSQDDRTAVLEDLRRCVAKRSLGRTTSTPTSAQDREAVDPARTTKCEIGRHRRAHPSPRRRGASPRRRRKPTTTRGRAASGVRWRARRGDRVRQRPAAGSGRAGRGRRPSGGGTSVQHHHAADLRLLERPVRPAHVLMVRRRWRMDHGAPGGKAYGALSVGVRTVAGSSDSSRSAAGRSAGGPWSP